MIVHHRGHHGEVGRDHVAYVPVGGFGDRCVFIAYEGESGQINEPFTR